MVPLTAGYFIPNLPPHDENTCPKNNLDEENISENQTNPSNQRTKWAIIFNSIALNFFSSQIR